MTGRYTANSDRRNHHGRTRTQRALRVARYFLMGALTAGSACPEYCSEPTDPGVGARDAILGVSTSPPQQRVAQGATTLFQVTIQRGNFAGPVTLSVPAPSVPPGVTIEFDPPTMAPGETQAVARVIVSETAPVQYVSEPPIFEIPVLATGPNGVRGSALLRAQLVASSRAGITLNVTPAAFSVQVGEVKEALVTIARQGNYSGPVTVALTRNAGLGATVTPVAGVPDTWVARISIDDPAVFIAGLLVGGSPVQFVISATPQGLPPVQVDLQVIALQPFIVPSAARNVSVAAGSQDTVTVFVGRSVGYSAPVAFSVDNAAAGITGTFAPNPALDGATRLTLRADANMSAGTYEVRLLAAPAEGSGATMKVARLNVLVTHPYVLTVPNVTVAAGRTTTDNVSVMRTGGFAGAVGVSFSATSGGALPVGMNITLGENPVLQSGTTIRVATTTATPAGTYPLRAVGVTGGAPTAIAPFTVNVTPAASAVASMQIEPQNAEITAPATQQFAARLFDASGAVIPVESGGAVEFTSSNTAVAGINLASGLASSVFTGSGIAIITARYVRNGIPVVQSFTSLTVYPAFSAGHYGSATMSTQGNVRTIRPGESVMFQIIVRAANGMPVTSGITPAPVVTSSNSTAIRIEPITGPVAGYFYFMTAAFGATPGTEVRIRYDVRGAGGELVIKVVASP